MAAASLPGPVVGILPARGGSKRIPRKNVRPFLGVPIISRTVGCLLAADVFDHVIVSTDDEEVASIAAEAGAEVPFRRPDALADDHTGTDAVIRHAIGQLEAEWETTLGYVCAVYPTAVLSLPQDIAGALRELTEWDADFVFSATPYSYPIQRALRRTPDGFCEMLHPEHLMTRSQDLENTFHDAGQFYWGTRDAWMEGKAAFTAKSRLHLLPAERVQDIDTEDDWRRAEVLFRVLAE